MSVAQLDSSVDELHCFRSEGRICIVTPSHISYNPRVVKEADTLSAAGYKVRVVSLNREDRKWQLDLALAESRPWRLESIDARPSSSIGKTRRFVSRLRSGSYARLLPAGAIPGVLERAYSRYFPDLVAAAKREPAQLYVAHNLPALPVAAAAARHWNARLGFDAEDFHRGELREDLENPRLLRQTIAVEQRYIPRCDYVTAASDGIGAAYVETLGIATPTTILNVFPLAARDVPNDPAATRGERPPRGLSLYWYSQVIGPGRGLEIALHALAALDSRFMLSLRGQWASGFKADFMALAERLGVTHLIHYLGTCPPDELVWRASLHDVGLASEVPDTTNRRIAITNKLLVYILAGIPAAVSDVPGQAALMARMPQAGFVYTARDAKRLAEGLAELSSSPDRLARAKAAARHAAETRLCWDLESAKLLRVIDGVLLREKTR